MYEFTKGMHGEDHVDHHLILETYGPRGEKAYEVMSAYIEKYLAWLIDEQRFKISTFKEQPPNEEWTFYDYNDLVEKLLVYEQSPECLKIVEEYEERCRKYKERNPSTEEETLLF